MKNILNKFLLITLLALPVTQVFGKENTVLQENVPSLKTEKNWKDKLTLENFKTGFNNIGKKAKTFLTNKKNIKPAILFTISLLALLKSNNYTKQANKICDAAKELESKQAPTDFVAQTLMEANKLYEQSWVSLIVSFIFGAWGLKSLVDNNK